MPLTTEQRVLRARLALGLAKANVEAPIAALDAGELVELDLILNEFEKTKLRPASLDSDGVKYDPEVHRGVLRQRLSILLGVGGLASGLPLILTVEPEA